jgi:hypothetical protein
MSLFDSASLVVTPNGTKASKLYAIKPTDGSGDLSVTRATTATRVNSSGLIESVATNVPRLDYTNGTCPSILVEPQRTNLLTYSEQFDNAAWNKQNCTITANTLNSPNGTNTADSLIASSGTATAKGLYLSESTSAPKSFSFFAKKGNRDWAVLLGYNGNNNVWFNISNGTIGTIGSNFINAKIENYGNGWYRCSATLNSSVAVLPNIGLYVSDSDNSLSCTGDGTTASLYIWGAQLEVGSYATSYIPTVASTVTRNADVISKTGISSLIGQTEGTMFFDLKTIANNDFKRLSINGGSYVNSIFFDFDNSNSLYAKVFNGGSAVATLIASGVNIANRNKIAIAYKNNDFSFYVNGVQVGSQTSGTVPSGLANYEFSLAGNQIFEGNINTSALWKTRLTNAELATLTTI